MMTTTTTTFKPVSKPECSGAAPLYHSASCWGAGILVSFLLFGYSWKQHDYDWTYILSRTGLVVFCFDKVSDTFPTTSFSKSPSLFRYISPVVDYMWLIGAIVACNALCTANLSNYSRLPMIASGAIVMMVIRDGTIMKMFPTLLAKEKVNRQPGWKELKGVLEMSVNAAILLFLLNSRSFLQIEAVTSPATYVLVWLEFFGMFLVNEIPMYFLHGWMHRSAWAFKHLHKKHHIAKKSCQSFDAFQFTFPDLLIEGGNAPFVVLAIKAAFGLPVTIHALSVTLLGIQQILAHSCNPHSLYFFNPILDHIFRVNIEHQLHHAVPSRAHETITNLSAAHLTNNSRRKLMQEYEKVFDVDLGHGLSSLE